MRPSDFTPVLDFPLALRPDGMTKMALTQRVAVEQLIEELLFTNPGERLNRPDLGAGTMEMVFEPLASEFVTATQFQIKAELQKWLGDVAQIVSVTAVADGSDLEISVGYELPDVSGVQTATFRR